MEIHNNNKVNNFTGVNRMDKEPENFQEQLNTMVKKLSKNAEYYVPEYGDFKPVMEFIPNLDKETSSTVGKYGLKIYKMPKHIEPDEKMRYLEAAAYMPAGDYKADAIVGSGNKAEIIKLLNSEEFAKNLNYTYSELLDTVKNS